LDAFIDAESKVNALDTGITYPKRFFRIWLGLYLLLQKCGEQVYGDWEDHRSPDQPSQAEDNASFIFP
jgi:hypothetical protein